MAQPDELVDFHHLRARRGMSQLEIEDQVREHECLGCRHLGLPFRTCRNKASLMGRACCCCSVGSWRLVH